ncbi:MAG: NAD(P)H-dependent oxidoreductase [Deltaproteobacteria bacterium]|nr:NAD(P)H-dependent oxidoreductase [Deltaproteobacteria bacterium]
MRRVLILFAHPVLERSRVNRRLMEAVNDLDGVTIQDLYEAYPTLSIDVAREQQLLVEHDVIVFQHPFYWYSCPAILKEWQDLVLEHGWAYGKGGTQLRGKTTLNAVTTGGPEVAYQKGGYNRFTVRELLTPWDQTAHLCGMKFLAPFAVHSALKISSDADIATARIAYRTLIEALRDDRIDLDRAAAAENLASELEHVLGPREVA